MKKILITGGAGFIAKNLIENLSNDNDYNIVPIDIKELNLFDSKRVMNFLKRGQFDAIIHTANYDASTEFTKNDPAKVLENNLKMFFNITRCKNYFGKMIYFGSGAEFGRENWKPKMKESDFGKNIPTDQYGFSKYIMTNFTKANSDIYNLRLFGVFGKYEDWRYRFISNTCCRAIFGMPIIINQNRRFDYLHVDDLAKIVKWFIDKNPANNILNACTGQPNALKSIADKIIKISGKKLKIKIKEKKPGREYSGDNTLLMNELNFKFNSIDDKIKELYNWYNLNKKTIEVKKL